jgi:hypothetical protein
VEKENKDKTLLCVLKAVAAVAAHAQGQALLWIPKTVATAPSLCLFFTATHLS